ncbi:hypothetical protein Q766_03220 [Flavobacterium subsaxonicum WB 4.1-42 = DSM 21790]|uniref:Uncharacterized protein n=1 Tax=Flavobacterium subsaxonicum WB 4.1-42 = DSM 21790 TaxID=1121898 RepID=A0A0A2MUI9_9FLAO|nr:hypothetical protein Q766_03220 [Flavobacterium subsaxonicum WB 4.1-42 = DSM 21790]
MGQPAGAFSHKAVSTRFGYANNFFGKCSVLTKPRADYTSRNNCCSFVKQHYVKMLKLVLYICPVAQQGSN